MEIKGRLNYEAVIILKRTCFELLLKSSCSYVWTYQTPFLIKYRTRFNIKIVMEYFNLSSNLNHSISYPIQKQFGLMLFCIILCVSYVCVQDTIQLNTNQHFNQTKSQHFSQSKYLYCIHYYKVNDKPFAGHTVRFLFQMRKAFALHCSETVLNPSCQNKSNLIHQ